MSKPVKQWWKPVDYKQPLLTLSSLQSILSKMKGKR